MKLELVLNIDTTLDGNYGWNGDAFREGVVDLVSAIGYTITRDLIGDADENDAIVRVFCDPNDHKQSGFYRILILRDWNGNHADITSVLLLLYRAVDRSGNFERVFTSIRDDKQSAELLVRRKTEKAKVETEAKQ